VKRCSSAFVRAGQPQSPLTSAGTNGDSVRARAQDHRVRRHSPVHVCTSKLYYWQSVECMACFQQGIGWHFLAGIPDLASARHVRAFWFFVVDIAGQFWPVTDRPLTQTGIRNDWRRETVKRKDVARQTGATTKKKKKERATLRFVDLSLAYDYFPFLSSEEP